MSEKELEKVEENTVSRSGKPKKEKKPKSKVAVVIDKIVTLVILVACICGLAYSGYMLYHWLIANIETNEVVSDVNTIAGVADIPEDEDPGAEFGINFESLLAENSECVGWIRIPGISVNYAIVQADDNSKYLKTSFDGSWNQFGWPFMDYRNSSDFTDKNTVLYGHNIASGWMFADLTYIYNCYLGTDVTIYIYRKDYRMLTYKVFSAYSIEPESYYLTTYFANDELFTDYLNTMKARSRWNFNQSVGADDTILTLSTCTADAKSRIVIQAKLISNEEMPR